MADFSSSIQIDATQAINQLDQLDKALGSTSIAMGTFQGIADKSIGGAGFAEVAKSADAFGKTASKALRDTETAAKQAQKGIRSVGLSYRDVGRIVESQIIFAAINGLRQGFFDAADAAAEFQLQVSRIAAISEELNFDSATQAVQDLAIELGRPLEEVGEAVFEALQNDLGTTAETIEILRNEAQQLALVTGGTLPQAVNALSSVFKTFGDELGTDATAAEQFFGTINAGRITLADLESSLGTLSPLAIQIGVSFKELTDSLATITLTGTKANVATTQLRNVFNKLIKPTDALKRVYQELGVSGFEQLLERTGSFINALDVLRDEVGDSEDGLSRLFNTIRGNVGVLNLLTNDTELYRETSERATESARQLGEEINNIESTAAREAAKNAAELEVILTRIGNRALQFKVAAGDAFLSFINQSNEAIALQGSLATGIAAATIAVTKFGVAAGVAFPPLLAFSAAVAAGGGAVLVLRELAEAASSLRQESNDLDVKILEAYVKNLESMRAEDIKEVTDAFDDQTTVLNRVVQVASEAGKAIRDSFDVDVSNIQAVEAELLSAFGDARTRVLGQIEDAIKDIDDQILDGTKRISNIQEDLEEFRFEVSIEDLSEAAQASARIQRATDKIGEAYEAIANVGIGEQSQELARNTAEAARASAKAALTAAERAGEERKIAEAQRTFESALQTQIALEQRLISLRTTVGRKALLEQQQAFENLSAEARQQVQEVLDARAEIAKATRDGASDAEISDLKQALVGEVNEARQALIETGQSAILDVFDLDEQFGKAIQTLTTGLDQTQIDWTEAVDQLRQELATRTDFVAAVTLQAELQGAAAGNALISKAVEDAVSQGGLPGERLQNAANAVKDTFVEQKNLQDQIQDSAAKTELSSARAIQSFEKATTGLAGLNSGAVEAAKLTGPVLEQLSQLGDLNEEQLKKLISNLEAALPAIAEQSTGLFGTFTEDQKTNLTAGVQAAIEAAQEQASTLEARKLFDPANLLAAEALLQRLSSQNIEGLEFAVDEEGLNAVNESLDQTTQKGRLATAAVGAIGRVGQQANGAIRALGQTTVSLVGQANQARSAYEQLLRIAQQALQTAREAASVSGSSGGNLFHGGQPIYRNGGGDSRGQDTISAMLSPGEFVVNAKSARNFLPELQSINSGNAPKQNVDSGSVINIGDINVNSSSQLPSSTAREVGLSIKRELRRGTFRL